MNKNIFYSERQANKNVSYTPRTEPTQNKLTQGFQQMPKISDVKGIQIYKRIQKPNLNIQKLNRIAKKLDLEEEAKMNFNNRKNTNQLVVKYDINPFSQVSISEIQPMQSTEMKISDIYFQQQQQFQPNQAQNRQDSTFRLIDLIKGVETFKNRNVNEVNINRDMNFSISKRSKEIQVFVNKAKESTLQQPLHPKTLVNISQIQAQHPNPKIINNMDQNQEHFANVMHFSDIINRKQKSYYQNQKIDNIFHLVFHKEENIKVGNQILDKYHFCHDSLKDMAKNVKIPFYRDISRLARNLMRNIYNKESKLEFLTVNELNVVMNNIPIQSIFSVAAGRSTPDDINEQMKQQHLKSAKQDQISSSATVEKEIWYSDNTISYGAQNNDDSDYINQSKQFLLIPYTKQEVKYENQMQQILKYLDLIQTQKQQIKSQHINDKQTMEQIERKEQKILQEMFFKGGNLQKEIIDRTIRRNKKFKDRREEIGIKSLTTAVVDKKKYDHKLNKRYGRQPHEVTTNA